LQEIHVLLQLAKTYSQATRGTTCRIQDTQHAVIGV
jgi:hypothetical protein